MLSASILVAIAGLVTAADPVPLGPEFIATSWTQNVQKQPWLAGSANGNLVLAYSQGSIFARRYDKNGTPLGPDFLVNSTINASLKDECYVSVDPVSGDFIILWSDRHGGDGHDMGCGARIYAADGTPRGPEFFVNSHWQFSQFEPYAAFSPTGKVFCVWTDAGTDGVAGVVGRVFDRFGNALTPEFLVNTPQSASQIDPSIATDYLGNVAVAFVDASGQTGESREVLCRLFTIEGVAKGPQFLVNSSSAGMQRDPFVAMSPLGRFLIVWQDESGTDGSGWGVYGRAFDAQGVALGPQFLLATTTAGDQKDPHVSVDYVGNYFVTWTHHDGVSIDIRGRRFDRHGNPLSGELPLHAPKPFDQTEPKTTLTQSGERIAAAWFDTNSDSYLRLYDLPLVVPSGPLTTGQSTTFDLEFGGGVGGQIYVLPIALSTGPGIVVPMARRLKLTPDDLFMLTFSFPDSPLWTGLAGTLGPDGAAAAQLHVPNDPQALGVSLSFVGLTLDPQSPGGVGVLTEPLTLTIQ